MRTTPLALFAAAVLGLCACPNGPGPAHGPVDCPGGEQRVQLDCSSEVDYQGTKGSGSVNVMDIAGASGSIEETAIRRVSEHIQQFASMHTRLCREYNSCVIDQAEYRAKADDIQKRLMLVPVLAEAVQNAKTETERLRALDQLYQAIVPDQDRVEEITFRFGLAAQYPESLGGGQFVLAPGGTVTTDTRVWITVDVSRDAYLYMFQTTPSGELTVLFPHPDMEGLGNPLRGRTPTRIPPSAGQYFRVNEKDVGTEKVYIVVSPEQVDDLDAALAKVNRGDITSVTQHALIQSVATGAAPSRQQTCKTRGLELVTSDGCVRSRGLELAGEPDRAVGPSTPSAGPSAALPSMEVRTSPGDNLIVKVFEFEHVTQDDFSRRGGTSKVKTRGIVLED